MKQDQEYDDLEKIATLLGHIGDAFAAMYREVGKHLADFGEKVAEAFEEAQAEREAAAHDDDESGT